MTQDRTALERAFELARTGQYRDLVEVKKRLQYEGFSLVQLEGKTLSKQLLSLIRASADA